MSSSHLSRPSSSLFIYGSLFLALLLNISPWGNHAWVPDWFLIALVFWTLNEPRKIGIGIAFIFGLLMDVQTSSILGVHSLSYSLVAFVTIAWHRRILDLSTPSQMFHLLPMFLIASGVNYLVFWVTKNSSVFDGLLIFVPSLVEILLWPAAKWMLSTPQRRQNKSLPL